MEMGEQDNTTKIAIVSVASFLETCATSLSEIAKTGMGTAGQTHLRSVGTMLKQCSQSLKSYAAHHKGDYIMEENDPDLAPDRQERFALQDESYLEAEQEMILARLLGTIGDDDGSSDQAVAETTLP
jgi:hypothetical protein